MRLMIGIRALWPIRPACRSSLWWRLSATCLAMITRRSWVSRHFSHSQSRNSQYRLWPFTAIITLWFLHRAQSGLRSDLAFAAALALVDDPLPAPPAGDCTALLFTMVVVEAETMALPGSWWLALWFEAALFTRPFGWPCGVPCSPAEWRECICWRPAEPRPPDIDRWPLATGWGELSEPTVVPVPPAPPCALCKNIALALLLITVVLLAASRALWVCASRLCCESRAFEATLLVDEPELETFGLRMPPYISLSWFGRFSWFDWFGWFGWFGFRDSLMLGEGWVKRKDGDGRDLLLWSYLPCFRWIGRMLERTVGMW